MSEPALWIREAEVCQLLDLPDAIDALESTLTEQAKGQAKNMEKTLAAFGEGGTLHAVGAVDEARGLVCTKTWAHTPGGANPLLILWDADTGQLQAIIEAFALGQMRTASSAGVATKWWAEESADELGVVGTGKQSVPQVAAVHAVRPLRRVRYFGRNAARRETFERRLRDQGFTFEIVAAKSAAEAVAGAPIVTLISRAKEPFLEAAMLDAGAHVNAMGAIARDREEFAQNLFPRVSAMAADNPETVRQLSTEFVSWAGTDEARWQRLQPIAQVVAEARSRGDDWDLTLFKSMGMGLADLAVGSEVLRRARASGLGRPIDAIEKTAPRLRRS